MQYDQNLINIVGISLKLQKTLQYNQNLRNIGVPPETYQFPPYILKCHRIDQNFENSIEI